MRLPSFAMRASAEEVGVEPTRPFGQTVFKTVAAAHRLALPRVKYEDSNLDPPAPQPRRNTVGYPQSCIVDSQGPVCNRTPAPDGVLRCVNIEFHRAIADLRATLTCRRPTCETVTQRDSNPQFPHRRACYHLLPCACCLLVRRWRTEANSNHPSVTSNARQCATPWGDG